MRILIDELMIWRDEWQETYTRMTSHELIIQPKALRGFVIERLIV